jgi:chromosome segregation ATPase
VGEDQSQTGRRRFTVAEASEVLGITVEAVRGRIKRGTLDHEPTDKGVFVFLEADQTTDQPRPDTDQTTDRLQSDSSALISAKDETIATLREQLEAERQSHAEARRIIAGLVEQIPAIEAPQEASKAAERVEDELDTERTRREMAEATLREGMAEEQRRREEAERERDDLRQELYALREARESSQTAGEEPERAEPLSATGEAQEPAQRRPWWRRVFGG